MNIHAEKLDLIQWISDLNDTSVINKLCEIKNSYTQSKDWRAQLKEDEMESINRGLKDLEEGRVHSHNTARDIYGKYL
ncbi:MAG TPA: hypothetical protein VJ919_12240 [Tangfeifania sp.]|nr:hypothetical protein [Tangfeifania sp.]